MEIDVFFLVALFAVALMYSSVGHGGASGYLALMALFGISTVYMRASALSLNLFVSAVSFYAFYKSGYFKLKILLPFIIGSIPMAFIGAHINIDQYVFKYILGAFLVVAVARMMMSPREKENELLKFNYPVAIFIGSFLGFFSGLIGIGGGIILSPVLLLLGWANVKETAAVSSIFIFLNSASGLLGLLSSGINLSPNIVYWVAVAFGGGLLGAYIGSSKLSFQRLKYLLAFVLFLASIKLFLT
ncbi:MAG: sulfite exporter TauE/SafE family protein [Chlorobi bacterium]|nr:sulfite exporter TauE/SafE family protein [Chlorobiota bacterium]